MFIMPKDSYGDYPSDEVPCLHDLWVTAGGGTEQYSSDKYIELCVQHGLVKLKEPSELDDDFLLGQIYHNLGTAIAVARLSNGKVFEIERFKVSGPLLVELSTRYDDDVVAILLGSVVEICAQNALTTDQLNGLNHQLNALMVLFTGKAVQL
jgi:hypothetical protein